MQHWTLLLPAYKYYIRYWPTSAHCNAHGLSHLRLVDSSSNGNYEDATVFNVAQLEVMPVQGSQVTTATRTNPILRQVLRYARTGWPDQVSESIYPYWLKREEIAIEGDCILCGTGIIVPKKLHQNVLEELHRSHPGVVHIKALTCSHIWRLGLDCDIENFVKT